MLRPNKGIGRLRSDIFESEEDMFPTDVVIVAGARTPMARYTGAFSEVSAIDLAAHASKEAIRRSGVDPAEFDHAIFGNVMQTSADALYGARHVGLKAGLRVETPAVTVNRLCGSGIEAVSQAAVAAVAERQLPRRAARRPASRRRSDEASSCASIVSSPAISFSALQLDYFPTAVQKQLEEPSGFGLMTFV